MCDLTCQVRAAPDVQKLNVGAGLQDQPQALVVQPGAVSEVEVSESEAVSQFPGVMRLLAGDEAGDKAAA